MTTPAEPQQPRQLMQNDPFSQPGYTDNFYDAVGGHETFVKPHRRLLRRRGHRSAAAADVSRKRTWRRPSAAS